MKILASIAAILLAFSVLDLASEAQEKQIEEDSKSERLDFLIKESSEENNNGELEDL